MKSTRWKNILVFIVDPFGDEQLALTKAAAIATRCGARLTLLNTFMLPQPTPDTVLGLNKQNIRLSIRDRGKRLERLASKLRRKGIKVDVTVEWDYPIQDAIVRQVFKLKPDLLVADSQRHGRIARWLLANTDWELIRNCPCPLWFVRSATLPKIPQVLVAVDPRHTHDKPARFDDRLLRTGKSLVAQLGGELAMAHAYETPLTASPGMFVEPIRIPVSPKKARDFAVATAKAVNRLGVKHGVKPKNRHVQEGESTHVLSTLASRRKVDVLLMGAVSRRLLQRPFIGNTAEKVIDQVTCDVFVVKPQGFKSMVSRVQPKLT